MKNEIIAIIPVRSGPKGIPRKNTRLSAENLKVFSPNGRRVYVSQVLGTVVILDEGINLNKNVDGSDDK